MKGIRLTWTEKHEEKMEAYLTLDQVRDHFGLGGTPDALVRTRLWQVASVSEMRAAAETLTQPRRVSWSAVQVSLMTTRTEEMPEQVVPDPQPCCPCHCKCGERGGAGDGSN